MLWKEPVRIGHTETSPGLHLKSEPKDLDIYTCRFECPCANTTAATNGLAIMQAVAASNER